MLVHVNAGCGGGEYVRGRGVASFGLFGSLARLAAVMMTSITVFT